MDWVELYHRLIADRSDAEAWDQLRTRVRVWARRALWERGWYAVEDAVEDTAAAVVMSLERAQGPSTFSGFVFGHFLNARRRALRDPLTQPLPDDMAGSPFSQPAAEDLEVLRLCLDELPDRERQAVRLRYFEEASAARIAELLGTSALNARQIVFRAITRLRDCMRRELGTDL